MMSVTNSLYRAARFGADVRAVRKGPKATAKRIVRRQVYRSTGRSTRRILKAFGL